MPFGNAISTALLTISCVTGLTGVRVLTVWSDAEKATYYSLADVAHLRPFDWAISSTDQDWYREGMRLFMYQHNGHYWNKRRITWTVLKYDSGRYPMPREESDRKIAEAFQKWAAASPVPFTFTRVSGRQADIQFTYEYIPREGWGTAHLEVELPRQKGALDDHVPIRITFDSASCWTEVEGLYNYSLRYAALYAIGEALGLDNSDDYDAIMCYTHERCRKFYKNPPLKEDDIRGIQALYRGKSSSEPTTRTHGGMNPGSTNRTYSGINQGPTNRPYSGMNPGLTNRTYSGTNPGLTNRMYGGMYPGLTNRTYSDMYPGSTNQTYDRNPAPSSSSSSTSSSSTSGSSTSSDASSDGDD